MQGDPDIESIPVRASEAMAELQRLRRSDPSSSFILSLEGSFVDRGFEPAEQRPIPEILAAADAISHPAALRAKATEEDRRSLAEYNAGLAIPPTRVLYQVSNPRMRAEYEAMRDELARAVAAGEPSVAPEGDWSPPGKRFPGPSILTDPATQQPAEDLCILRIPTADWTTIPAYLRSGGWNMCPPTEYHIAAFRSWRDRFGAELVAMRGDTVELRVQRPVKTRAEAMALAAEMYLYCNESETLAIAASELLDNEWWFFWWD